MIFRIKIFFAVGLFIAASVLHASSASESWDDNAERNLRSILSAPDAMTLQIKILRHHIFEELVKMLSRPGEIVATGRSREVLLTLEEEKEVLKSMIDEINQRCIVFQTIAEFPATQKIPFLAAYFHGLNSSSESIAEELAKVSTSLDQIKENIRWLKISNTRDERMVAYRRINIALKQLAKQHKEISLQLLGLDQNARQIRDQLFNGESCDLDLANELGQMSDDMPENVTKH